MSRQIILEFPDDFPEEVLRNTEILKEGKTVIVLKLLREGIISQHKAAAWLEIDGETLSDLIESHDVSGHEADEKKVNDPTTNTAGAWKDLLDCQAFEQEIYKSRACPPGPEVRL